MITFSSENLSSFFTFSFVYLLILFFTFLFFSFFNFPRRILEFKTLIHAQLPVSTFWQFAVGSTCTFWQFAVGLTCTFWQFAVGLTCTFWQFAVGLCPPFGSLSWACVHLLAVCRGLVSTFWQFAVGLTFIETGHPVHGTNVHLVLVCHVAPMKVSTQMTMSSFTLYRMCISYRICA